MTTVCVVGSGAREHALARSLARSADDVVVAPGNAGIETLEAGAGNIRCSPAPPLEIDADLVVIGPEAPLVAGMADRLRSGGRLVFGPGQEGARLEGSKAWMKHVLEVASVPTAAYATFDQVEPAVAWLRARPGPWAVKADGLAGGKGVLVTADFAAAAADVEAKLSGRAFGSAGRRVVLEEGLSGPELSVMAICADGRATPLAAAQDFKQLGDGGKGPNTGGMGAYSPVRAAPSALVDGVMDRVVEPTLAALGRRGIDYRGVLYAGLMLTEDGPKVLEFNVRFGDPEAQAVLARFDGDLTGVLAAAASGSVDGGDGGKSASLDFADRAAVTVVLAAAGYPESPRRGDRISGLEVAGAMPDVQVLAAGVGRDDARDLITAGGRVLCVTATGADLPGARNRAYEAVASISWPDMAYRRDIAAAAARPDEEAAKA
jgi:phosphoribosylamine---glycine ligase